MADLSPKTPQNCLLLYDGQCRLCVTAKRGLEQLGTEHAPGEVRMIPYQSEEAKQVLGTRYRSGRPDVAFLVYPDGKVATGLPRRLYWSLCGAALLALGVGAITSTRVGATSCVPVIT